MSKRPWMPFFYNDFSQDTKGLTAEEKGICMELLCIAWKRGTGTLPNDMEGLKKMLQREFADFHGHTFNRIIPKLLREYFIFEDNCWRQTRVSKELQTLRKRSTNGQQNAVKRWFAVNNNKYLGDAKPIPKSMPKNGTHTHISNSSFLTVSETTSREEEKAVGEKARSASLTPTPELLKSLERWRR